MSDSHVEILGKVSSHELCHLHTTLQQRTSTSDEKLAAGIFVLYGSWNTGFEPSNIMNSIAGLSKQCIVTMNSVVVGFCQVDESEESLAACLGDNEALHSMGPVPPSELPALVIVAQHESMDHSVSEFVSDIPPSKLLRLGATGVIQSWLPHARDVANSLLSQVTTIPTSDQQEQEDAIRIFVSGDKSSVGKSSVCLGILASLVSMGYDPSSLAYIKPATQCEAPQLIQAYCENVGIPCVAVGPVVYYKGFTRAFLAGETDSTNELLASGGQAVDELARGKRLVMIDGVGFPSVGSICGTDNASMALACGYPTEDGARSPVGVLIVGGSGVGAAVDAFNLNATYFQARNVPVIGAIFNKLSLDGFYSLENCREQVAKYFDQTAGASRPFGFVPLTPGIAGDSAMDHVEDYIRLFREHVDVKGIVEAAARYVPSMPERDAEATNGKPAKRSKLNGTATTSKPTLSRDAIEAKAKQAGAAPSA